MVEEVRQQLRELNEIRRGDAVGNMDDYFARMITEVHERVESSSQLESLCADFWDKHKGVPRILDVRFRPRNGKDPEPNDLKKGFTVVTEMLNQMQKHGILRVLPPHQTTTQVGSECSCVTCVCLYTARHHKDAHVRGEAFEPLLVLCGRANGKTVVSEDDAQRVCQGLLEDYSRDTSSVGGVKWKAYTFRVLGKICQGYKDMVTTRCFRAKHGGSERQQTLFTAILFRVQKVLSDPKNQAGILASCFDAMDLIFDSLEGEVPEKDMLNTYCAIMATIAFSSGEDQESRYEKATTALRLLGSHGMAFSRFFHSTPEFPSTEVFLNLVQCCRHKNSAVSKEALQAIDAFLGCLHLSLSSESAVFDELLTKFRTMFDTSQDWDSHKMADVLIAIRGFGALSPLVKDGNKRQQWFLECAGYLERVMNTADTEHGYEVLHQLPEIIVALADILNGAGNLASLIADHEGTADILDHTFCSLYAHYERAGASRRFLYERAWFYLMFALYQGDALEAMLQRTMLSIVGSTIKPVKDDAVSPPGMMPSGIEKAQPCVRFVSLWKSVSTGKHSKWLDKRGREGCTAEVQQAIAAVLYLHFIETVIQILDRLDLQLTDPEETPEGEASLGQEEAEPSNTVFVSQASGMSGRERPSNQNEFDMFLNLVLFFERVMTPSVDANFMVHCYYDLCKTLVRGSTKNPLISGYFKILTSCMRIVDKGGFLDKGSGGAAGRDSEMSKASSEADLCTYLISKFAREAVGRCDKIFDDLLASCLAFVLSLPKQMREFDVQVPALQAALKLGVDSPEMAICALETLESWVRFDIVSVRRYLPTVLPLLNDFLILPVSSEDGASRSKFESIEVANRRAVAQSKRESRRAKYRSAEDAEEKFGAKQIALRTMKLLGKLGSESALLVQDGMLQDDQERQIADFDTCMRLLEVDVTGGAKGADNYALDPVLPRIVHLAERSVDRKLRVAACECLHALILLAVGMHNGLAQPRKDSERGATLQGFDSLFRFLFPVVLRLAVSVESVASQMFEPLAKQLVHWFCTGGGAEADVLLDAVLQSLESSSDGKVREGASKLLSEYVVWTLKGLTTAAMRESAQRPRSLLLRMYGLMNHPNASKRIGAYLAIRELGSNPQGLVAHEVVVDQFLLELMHNMVLSLKFVDGDDPVLKMPTIALRALTALEKILDKHRAMLKDDRVSIRNQVKNPRRLHQNLACFVEWLFEQTGAHQKTCRRYCQKLFSKLCGHLSVPKTWIRDQMQKRSDLLVEIYEVDLVVHAKAASSMDVELAKMRHLITVLDAYEWLLRVAYVLPADVFCSKSKMLNSVGDFVCNATREQPLLEKVSTRDAVRYQNSKANCVYATLKLVSTLLDTYHGDVMVEKHMSELVPKLMEVLFLALLAPSELELDVVGDPVVFEEIPNQVDALLRAIITKHAGLAAEIKSFLTRFLSSGEGPSTINLQTINVNQSKFSSEELCLLFAGYQHLGVLDLIPEGLCSGMAEKLLRAAWEMIFGDVTDFDHEASRDDSDNQKKELNPSRRAVAEAMIQLSFFLQNSLNRVWQLFEHGQKSRGWTFYVSFRECVLDCISANIATDSIVFNKASDQPMLTDVLLNLLDSHISLLARDSTTKAGLQAEKLACAFLDKSNFDLIPKLIPVAHQSDNQHRLRQAIEMLHKILCLQKILSGSAPLRTAFDGVRIGIISTFCSCLQALLASPTDAALKNVVLAFKALPLILDQVTESEALDVFGAVRSVLSRYAPPMEANAEIRKSSSSFQNYSTVFSALLFAVSQCRTATALPLLCDIIMKVKGPSFDKDIAEALDAYILGMEEDEQERLLETLLSEVSTATAGKDVDLDLQRDKIEMLALRIVERLSVSNETSLVAAFGSHIRSWVEILESRAEGDDVPGILNRKICVLNLVQSMFRHMSYETIKEHVSPKYTVMESLTQKLVQECLNARKMDGPSQAQPASAQPGWWRAEDTLRRLVYKFHRTLQNTLTAIISRWQNEAKGDASFKRYCILITSFPWDNIVDKEARHKFSVQTRFKESYDYLATFRRKQTAAAHAKGRDHADLNQLVYQTARSMASVVPSIQTFSSFRESATVVSMVQGPDDGSDIVLDDDHGDVGEGFNSNECMRPLLALLDRLRVQFPSTNQMPVWMKALRDRMQSKDENRNVRMFVAKVIINHANRLARADGSARDPFKPFALDFFEAFFHEDHGLVYVVTHKDHWVGSADDTSNAFNFFLRDICRLWMEWMRQEQGLKAFAFSNKEQVDMAWVFIWRLMSVLTHEDKQVVSSNVTFFEFFFRAWRIPGEDIGEPFAKCMSRTEKMLKQFKHLLPSKDSQGKEPNKVTLLTTLAGLNVLLAVTRIELDFLRDETTASHIRRIPGINPPGTDGARGDLQTFFNLCLEMLAPHKGTHKDILKATTTPAAMACAQVLACAAYEVKSAGAGQRRVTSKEEVAKMTEDLTKTIRNVEKGKEPEGGIVRALQIVEQIVIYYPEFAMEQHTFNIAKEWYYKLEAGSLALIPQQVFLRRSICIWKLEDAEQLLNQGRKLVDEIENNLSHSIKVLSDKVQLLALRTLTGRRHNGDLLDDKGQAVEVSKCTAGLLKFMDVNNLRRILIDTGAIQKLARHANKVCRYHCFLMLKDIHDLDHLNPLFKDEGMHSYFVTALSDGDERLRDLAFQWWDANLEKDFSLRMLQMLEKMISPSGNDSSWLCSATMLLLDVAKHTTDTKVNFFKQPLQQNATFSDVSFDTTFRAGSLPMMTPMFSSLSTSSQSQWMGSQTQGMGGGGVLATLVADSDTGMDVDKATDEFLAAQTLQATDMAGGRHAVKRGNVGARGVIRAVSAAASVRGGAFAAPAPKDRFDRGAKEADTKQMGLIMARRQEERREAEKRSKEARNKQVSLIRRKYRVGEVPDIQSLTKEDVFNTLQKVVQLDSASARLVFSHLYSAVETRKTNVKDFEEAMRVGIEGMLVRMQGGQDKTASVGAASDAAEALLDVANAAQIKLTSSVVAQACAHPHVSALFQGIRALERQSKMRGVVDVPMGMSRKRSLPASEFLKGAAKRRADEEMTDDDLLQLARLYEKLEENDIALGQCEQICKLQETRDALSKELLGDHHGAVQLYLQLLNRYDDGENDWGGVKPTELEIKQWETGYNNCLRGLLSWTRLKDGIRNDVDDRVDDIWDFGKYGRSHLQQYMRALVGLAPKQMAAGTELVSWVDDCWGNEALADRRQVLESDFGVETSLALLLDPHKDTAMPKELIRREMDRFLAGWSESIGPVVKRKRLRQLQRIIELDEYVHVLVDNRDGAHELISAWSDRIPSRGDDDRDSWDFVLSSRIALSKRLAQVCDLSTSVQHAINASIAKLNLSMSKVARAQGSITVAELYLHQVTEWGGSDLHYCYGNVKLLMAQSVARDKGPEARLRFLRNADGELSAKETLLKGSSTRDRAKYWSLWGQIKGRMLESLENADAGGLTVESVTGKFSQALKLVEEARDSCSSLEPKILLKLALFCDKTAEREERQNAMPVCGSPSVWMYVDSMLHATALGSCKAREHFPRVLELLERHYSDMREEEVTKRLEGVPPWMLLEWLPQIFSLVARNPPVPCADCFITCLGRIAAVFPQAVYYAYRVVRDDIANDSARSDKIASLLGDYQATERLCRALQLLQHPDAQIQNFLSNILVPMVSSRARTKQEPLISKEIEVAYQEVHEDCLDPNNKLVGQLRKEFRVERIEKESSPLSFLKGLGTGGKLSVAMNEAKAKQIEKSMNKHMQEKAITGKPNMSLAYFTNALESCDSDGVTLRIPGMEMGSSAIALADGEASFVNLVSCDGTLKVLTSIQKPKRLKMRGGDGHEYWWLVKGGEDLRQDQRVQQAFRTMNRILESDTQCAKRRLALEVYKVVPISKVFGIIEWVRDTDTTLQEMINDSAAKLLKKTGSQAKDVFADMCMKHNQNIGTEADPQHLEMIASAANKSFNRKIDRFLELQEKLPLTTLRHGLMSKAQTAQREFEVRSNFAQSLSASSCCQYILGIGDRHTGNLLINDRNGKLMAIDFGHAFGSAVQLLPIQELMPFRLTRQMVGVLAPLEPHGLLKRSMTYAMVALRANKDVLRRTLEIFASDPTVDWEKHANKFCKLQGQSGEITKWIAATKIQALEEKLDGVHPSEVMLRELQKCVVQKTSDAANDPNSGLNVVVCGRAGSGRRKLFERSIEKQDYILNEKEQVDVLVEQATDPAVLCCTYFGWSPYL